MRTSYKLALDNIKIALGSSEFSSETDQDTLVAIGSSLAVFDINNFDDRMSVDTLSSRGVRTGFGFQSEYEYVLDFFDQFPKLNHEDVETFPVGFGSTTPYVGYKTVQTAVENVTKAMLLAILDGDSKRTANVGIGSTVGKKEIFYNCLALPKFRLSSIKPWSNWNESVGVCTPTSISRSNNVAIVTTTPAHGMSSSYDDWGIIMNLNTGVATSFNISTTLYPNGVPIKIIDANTFSYTNYGINTSITSVVGIASIQVGWGGTSNNLHRQII